MRNPLRTEAEAFRFLLVVIGGAVVIAAFAYANTWLGVAAAVLVVGGIGWWLMRNAAVHEPPQTRLATETPAGVRRVLVLAVPGTSSVPAPDSTETLVVVPALASAVEALTGGVDDRRAEAERTALALAASLPHARGVVGADDPALAVEDALREFGADEVVVVGAEDGVLEAIRERVAVPVSRA